MGRNGEGVFYLNLRRAPITTVSDFVESFLSTIDARYFLVRSRFLDVSPVRGGEIVVVKADFSCRDLKRSMELLLPVLERYRRETGPSVIRYDRCMSE